MNVRLNRTNYYPGTCVVCGTDVPAQRGFVLSRDAVAVDAPGTRKWLTLCTSRQCAAAAVGQDAVAEADTRELRADGAIVMPYDEAALPLLRAIAKWDGDARCWRASTLLRDRDLVLSVADKLGLAVDESLREYEDPDFVRAAVERARAIPTIRDYQVEGVRWLAYRGTATGAPPDFIDKKNGALLADDQGIGKTIQTLLSVHDDEALLVICPANAKAVWVREAKKWRPDRFDSVVVCDGEESFVWPSSPREMVVINYDVLPLTPAQIKEEKAKCEDKISAVDRLIAEIEATIESGTGLHNEKGYQSVDFAQDELTKARRGRKRWAKKLAANAKRKPAGDPPCKTLLVLDEAHYVENNKALRTVRTRHLAGKVDRLYGLTGTPVEAEPLKLWGLLTTLRCNPFSWTSFLRQFNGHAGRWGGFEFDREVPRLGSTARGPVKVEPGTTEILQRSMLRRTKDEVLTELPPKVYSEIPVPLPAKLVKALDEIAAEHIDTILRGELPPFEAMAAVRKALAAASIPAMLEFVEGFESAGVPLGVFSAHRGPIEKLGKRKGWYAITGDTSSKKRGEIQDAFQAGEGCGVAGTSAMAEAMTLTRASTVLFVDRFWRSKDNRQAEDRFHRIGQHDSVNVVTLVPDHPLTQHVADLLGSKYAFVDAVLHGEQTYDKPPSRFTDVDEKTWRARVEAKAEADRKREAAEQQRAREKRERDLAKIAEREVSPKISEQRAKLRAQRLGIDLARLAHVPADVVQEALSYMLSVCDGAQAKDNEGFNKPHGCVARWLAPGVYVGSEHAVRSAAAILRHYPRQLAGDFPALFSEPPTPIGEDTCS